MRKNLLKTMLVAVGLVMGVNGTWGQTQTKTWTIDPTDANPFKDRSRITSTVIDDTYLGSVVQFVCAHNAQNGYSFSDYNFADSIKEVKVTKFTFDIDYYNTKGGRAILTIGDGTVRGITGGSSKVTYNNTGAIFALGSNDKNALLNGASQTQANYTDKWMHLTVTVDMENQTTDYKITDLNNNVIKEATGIAFYADNVMNCSQIDLFGYINNSTCAKIGKIKVKAEYKQVSFASYTIKYVDGNNNILKKSRTGSGVVGDAVNITETDKQSFKNDDFSKKYIYESDDAENQTIAEDGSTTVTIKFREAETYHYTVYTVVAGNKKQIDEGWEFEGETMYVNYPRYLEQDGTLYYINKNSSGGYFQKYFTLTQDNQEETINYTAGSKGVVYLAEAEKINGLSYSSAANSDIRCSNGSCAYNAGENDVVITTLPAGKYKLYTSVWGAKGTEFVFKAGDNKIASTYKWTDENKTDPVPNSDGLFTSKGYIIDYESEEITLLSETDITLGTTADGSRGIDFVYIIKTGDATETVSVSDAGLATYCPSCDLDFTNAENIVAYKATIDADASTVTLTKVTTVAKGEGVLLRSLNEGAAEENIDMTVDAQKNDGNDFVGVETDIESLATETDGHTNYILNNVDGVIGFYKAAGNSVAAGKAYLQVPTTAANAKSLKIVFGDTTGISEINNTAKADGTYYSISGVRVANPTKGLYIQNGKKVIVK